MLTANVLKCGPDFTETQLTVNGMRLPPEPRVPGLAGGSV